MAETVRKTIEMFLQRMHEVSGAGGSIATDPVVLSLYQNLNALQPQLLQQIDEVQQKKGGSVFSDTKASGLGVSGETNNIP